MNYIVCNNLEGLKGVPAQCIYYDRERALLWFWILSNDQGFGYANDCALYFYSVGEAGAEKGKPTLVKSIECKNLYCGLGFVVLEEEQRGGFADTVSEPYGITKKWPERLVGNSYAEMVVLQTDEKPDLNVLWLIARDLSRELASKQNKDTLELRLGRHILKPATIESFMKGRTGCYASLHHLLEKQRVYFLMASAFSFLECFLEGLREYMLVADGSGAHYVASFEVASFDAAEELCIKSSEYESVCPNLDSLLAALAHSAYKSIYDDPNANRKELSKIVPRGNYHAAQGFAALYFEHFDSVIDEVQSLNPIFCML